AGGGGKQARVRDVAKSFRKLPARSKPAWRCGGSTDRERRVASNGVRLHRRHDRSIFDGGICESGELTRIQPGGWNPNLACSSPQSESTNQSFWMELACAGASASAFSTLPFKQ